MDPIQYLRAFRRRWAVIAASVVVAIVAAWVTTATVAPVGPAETTYAATTLLWNNSTPTVSGSTAPITLNALVRLTTLPDVAALAAERLDYRGDFIALRSQVQVQPDAEGEAFLDVTGVSRDPKEAERIAEAFSASLIDYLQKLQVRQLEQQAATLRKQIRTLQAQGAGRTQIAALWAAIDQVEVEKSLPAPLTLLQHAQAEPAPVTGFEPPSSRTSRLLIAALVGLLAGLGLALALERFDTKIRTRQAAEDHFGLPVLAEVPVLRRGQRSEVTVAAHPTGTAADAFRILGAGVLLGAVADAASGNGREPATGGRKPETPRTILVTSPGPSDGKTIVAANLAAAFGELGKQVLVLSCDLRRPSIHRLFGVGVGPGLVDALASEGPITLSPLPTKVQNVRIVPSGVAGGSPGELLGSARMRDLLRQARAKVDVVILDTSPVLVANDVTPLLSQIDAVVLVARANRTRAELAERTGDVLRRLGAPVAGLALNCAREISMPTAYRRYYHRRLPQPVREREVPSA